MRRVVPPLLLYGSLALLVLPGCSYYVIRPQQSKVDLMPGEEKSVSFSTLTSAVNFGNYYGVLPESIDLPEGKGVSAKLDSDKVVISADKEAKPATVHITVKSSKADKDVTIEVNIVTKESSGKKEGTGREEGSSKKSDK
jgi:hypothetical protein